MENGLILLKGGDYTAKIDPQRGGNCISLRHDGWDAVLLREPKEMPLDNPYLYGMPILFPVNRIQGGSFVFEEREYRFPINEEKTGCHLHGTLHETPFSVEEQGEDHVRLSFSGAYHDFPHAFSVEILYRLDDKGLSQRTTVRNESDTNMPCFLGFHTTFNIPFIKGSTAKEERVLAEVTDEIERNMKVFLPTGNILPPDDITKRINSGTFLPHEKPISRHYRKSGNGTIQLIDQKAGVRLVYENDEKFGYRLFYNGNADTYICLEPQNCMANCQNAPFPREETGFDFIPPHSKKCYESRIFLQRIE